MKQTLRMSLAVLPALVAVLGALAVAGCKPATTSSKSSDNRLLALALSQAFGQADGREGFTVVDPTTSIGPGGGDVENLQRVKEYVSKQLKLPPRGGQPVDLSALLDAFIAKNRQPVRLTLASAPEKGYVVDYEGLYTKYFAEGGGGWQALKKEHPEVHGMTSVSLPVYDEKTGIVLLYIGTQFAPLAGAGHLIAYTFDGTTLTEVSRVMLWIS